MPRTDVLALVAFVSVAAGCAAPTGADEDVGAGAAANTTELRPAEVDFVAPQVDLEIPPTPGRRPTTDDVVVRGGFDGRTPDEVVELVRGRATTSVHASRARFVDATIRDTHKRFTLVVNNAFVPGNPTSTFVAARLTAGARVRVVGVMSAVNPVFVVVEAAGAAPRAFVRDGAGYAERAMPYQRVMEAEVRLEPAGVKLAYPSWSVPALASPTG